MLLLVYLILAAVAVVVAVLGYLVLTFNHMAAMAAVELLFCDISLLNKYSITENL